MILKLGYAAQLYTQSECARVLGLSKGVYKIKVTLMLTRRTSLPLPSPHLSSILQSSRATVCSLMNRNPVLRSGIRITSSSSCSLPFFAETVRGDHHSVPCPDGSEGLTQAVYESGNVTAWTSVTCVPGGEFREYAGAVILQGEDFTSLTGIQDRAFHYMYVSDTRTLPTLLC